MHIIRKLYVIGRICAQLFFLLYTLCSQYLLNLYTFLQTHVYIIYEELTLYFLRISRNAKYARILCTFLRFFETFSSWDPFYYTLIVAYFQ